jgi:hypothetical protein
VLRWRCLTDSRFTLEQPEDGSVYVIGYFGVPARRRGEFFAIGLLLGDEGRDEAAPSRSIGQRGRGRETLSVRG